MRSCLPRLRPSQHTGRMPRRPDQAQLLRDDWRLIGGHSSSLPGALLPPPLRRWLSTHLRRVEDGEPGDWSSLPTTLWRRWISRSSTTGSATARSIGWNCASVRVRRSLTTCKRCGRPRFRSSERTRGDARKAMARSREIDADTKVVDGIIDERWPRSIKKQLGRPNLS